ncbi:MAG TPA: cytochrome c3 family protein [Nitrospira sp.]|nr:cytochrome c3 family protein [Nitrospira sp.]
MAWANIKSRPVSAAIVLGLTALFAVSIGIMYSMGSADLAGQDRQPIAFSHARHAGDLRIDCLYCHRAASVSTAAGIPSMRTCIGCHQNVARDSPEIRALAASWETQQPVEWVRLHRLPDFVYFTHERHLESGLSCVTCHGHVENMSLTPRAASFEMGWCVSCHVAQGVSRDCWTCHK